MDIDNNNLPNLSRLMYTNYPKGFRSFFIVGRRNIGKSCYALKCAYWAFRKMGFSDAESWEKALHSICFTIQDVIDYLKYAAINDIKEFLLIWDDVRVFASGSQYFLNLELVQQLNGVLDTIKIVLNNMILTSPSIEGILGILKTYDDYHIIINQSPDGGDYRLAKGYQWSTSPGGQKRIYKKFRDNYNCMLPDWVYTLYMKKRKQITFNAIYNLEEIVQRKDKRFRSY